jgi:hypothetical protein
MGLQRNGSLPSLVLWMALKVTTAKYINSLAAVAAVAIMMTAGSITTVDAAKKKQYQYRPETTRPSVRSRSDAPSLDGRVTGYPRTCGLDRFQRDDQGTPVGPYCH